MSRKILSTASRYYLLLLLSFLFATGMQAQEILKDGGIETVRSSVFTGTADNNVAGTFSLQNNSTALLQCPDLTGELLNKRRIQNIVTVKLDEETTRYIPNDFTCTLRLNIIYGPGANDNIDRDFIITYNKAEGTTYQAKQYFTFEGASSVRVTIKQFVGSVPSFSGFDIRDLLVVENEMRITRYYALSSNASLRQPSPFTGNVSADVLNISWEWPDGCGNNYTQLEYTWLEDELESYYSKNGSLDYDLLFANNATRIDLPLKKAGYSVPMLFPGTGKLFYRIRAVSQASENRSEGEWSTVRYAAGGYDVVRNWQVRTSFAEEGKYKTVMEYFDGSLRSRQVSTRDNTGVQIVAETMYDEQGRPAVQVLPAPLLYGGFEFRPNLNTFQGQTDTDDPADFFDLDATPKPMVPSTAKGAAGYYSISNSDLTGVNRFIPDAEGYPYTLTRYTPDGTGRVLSQSGVGNTFKTGSGHETKYYYGSPAQEELDGLFGTDVGNKSHYFKNMVKDANGQKSVSYVDMHGRTIATALSGAVIPANLIALDYQNQDLYPNQAGTYMTRNLLDEHSNVIKGSSLESITTLLVPEETTYNFQYVLNPESLQSAACPGSPQPVICHDCMYDLEIVIADESGERPPFIKRLTNVNLNNNTACDGAPAFIDSSTNITSNIISFPVLLGEGSYSVRKTLTVSEASIQHYKELWLQQNVCKTQEQLRDSIYQVLLLTTDCGNPNPTANACQECQSSLGDYSTQYKPAYLASIGQTGAVSTELENEIRAAYDLAAENCRLLCGTASQTVATKRELMLQDMMPGGQYAKLPASTSGTSMFNAYDIFSTSRSGSSTAAFRLPLTELSGAAGFYKDEAGNKDATIYPDGTNALLNNISAEDFSSFFSKSWANALLPYHPEYQRLIYAESADMTAAYNWINTFGNTNDHATASANGYFNVPNNDPFYTTPGSSLKSTMQGWVGTNFAGGLSMWQIARGTVMCKTVTDPAAKEACYGTAVNVSNPFAGITSAADRDEMWTVFRDLYISQRDQQVDAHIAAARAVANEQNLIQQQYQIRFPTTAVIAQQNGVGGWMPATPGAAPANPILNVPQDSLAAYTGQTTCSAYISDWQTTLLNCPAVAAHPQKDSILAKILRGMEAVCVKGTDLNHPNGSSTVSPTVPPDGSPRSFEEVINVVFAQYNVPITDLCNAYVIEYPKPYNTGLTVPAGGQSDTTACVCDKFATISEAAVAAGYNPANMASLNQYLDITYGDTVNQALFDVLKNCGPWARSLPSDTLRYPFFLQCATTVSPCLTCADLSRLILQYKDTLTAPFNQAPELGGVYTDSILRRQEMLARFLNFRTGNSYSWSEYLAAAAAANCDLALLLQNTGANIEGLLEILDIPTRANPAPSEYVASKQVNFLPGFESNPNDNFTAYIMDSSGSQVVVICPAPAFNQDTSGLIIQPPPCQKAYIMADALATQLYEQRLRNVLADFEKRYRLKCLTATESFTVGYITPEYHYTLYYYDMAGSLVRTVPPKGVRPDFSPAFTDAVKAARANKTELRPAHELVTEYRYNSLGQVVAQQSPDGGYSEFWYDNLGRLVVSRNAQQLEDGKYSYTRYDALGRIIEVGQKPVAGAMTQAISRDITALSNWILNGAAREQLTLTRYDRAYGTDLEDGEPILQGGMTQRNLRNRVSFTSTRKLSSDSYHETATFYTYDIHGNVDTLLQDYRGVAAMSNDRFKLIAYDYDLISGKVNGVDYQPDHYNGSTWTVNPDKFFHRYQYDGENRLTEVRTSRDKLSWEREAAYQYYQHGPLARMVVGEQQVQGVDYAYTLQGWLKGVNSVTVGDGVHDMGRDGATENKSVARDVYGFGLHYYDDNGSQQDYKPIDVTAGAFVRPGAGANMASLYNGNIAGMSVNIAALQKGGAGTNAEPLFYQYRYDQLNRLKAMQTFNGLSSNSWTPVAIDDHKEWVVYDPNGNILSYHRKGAPRAGKATEMDQLKYYYDAQTNRLNHVYDSVSNSAYTEDLESQDADNYLYDKIGNLKRDVKEGITNITWNVYGKIQQIVKGSNTITYLYDAAGNRISKTVSATNLTTVYVRDASGNVMSVYEKPASGSLVQKELQIYGSSRLGLVTTMSIAPVDVSLSGSLTGTWRTFVRGEKLFELSNHLGNALATVSDRKVQVNASGSVGYYTADVKSATDYYPFGMGMVGRSWQAGGYRYGFNGKEKSDEVYGEGNVYDYGFRIYNPRLGRFLSVDPLTKEYPWYTPYQFAGNTPVQAIDLDGEEEKHYTLTFNKDGTSTLTLTYTKEYNDIPLWLRVVTLGLGPKRTKITERAVVTYNGKKHYIGFAGSYGRGNENGMELFKEFQKDPIAPMFPMMFLNEEQSYGVEDFSIAVQLQNNATMYGPLTDKAWYSRFGEKYGRSSGRERQIKGLKYEEFLVQKFGGKGGFTAKSPTASRQFDGKYGVDHNIWYEAKSGDFFGEDFTAKKFEDFKSDIGRGLNVAKANGATYEVISESTIPNYVKEFLDKKGVRYQENVKQEGQ